MQRAINDYGENANIDWSAEINRIYGLVLDAAGHPESPYGEEAGRPNDPPSLRQNPLWVNTEAVLSNIALELETAGYLPTWVEKKIRAGADIGPITNAGTGVEVASGWVHGKWSDEYSWVGFNFRGVDLASYGYAVREGALEGIGRFRSGLKELSWKLTLPGLIQHGANNVNTLLSDQVSGVDKTRLVTSQIAPFTNGAWQMYDVYNSYNEDGLLGAVQTYSANTTANGLEAATVWAGAELSSLRFNAKPQPIKSLGAAARGFSKNSFKSVNSSLLSKYGIKDIHAFKQDFLGRNAILKHFDVVKHTQSGELLIIRKSTQEIIEHTGTFIK